MKCLFAMLAMTSLFGCNNLRWGMVGNKGNTPAPGAQPPSAAALVSYLNNNSERLQSVRFEEVDLTCTQNLQSVGLRGKMMLEKPRNFRMGADSLGKRMVDLGSNNQEFWFWVSQGDPYQYFCSYKDLNDGRVRHMPFPFQPDWIIDTLGLGSYGPAEKYQLEAEQDTLQLVENATSPQGAPIRKTIVFRRREAFPPQPQVTDYLLTDAAGTEICSAHIIDTQLDRTTKAVVPRRIELRWPAQKLKLAMKLDGMATNLSLPSEAFVRRPLQGVPSLNLATGTQEPTVQATQGFGGPPPLPIPK